MIETRIRRRSVLLGVIVALAVGALVVPGVAVAQTNTSNLSNASPYYTNESSDVANATWFAGMENVTLDSVVGMATRLGPFIVGRGDQLPGGVGFAGPVVLALVLVGVFLGAVRGTEIGSTGAAVLSLTVAYGFVEVGLAAAWLKVVLLFLLGIVVAVVLIRAAR